jgi:hypothetical protein
MADSTVIPQQPQTDKALNVKDPSTIDDTATFSYNTTNNFTINDYTTLIQDTQNITTPSNFPNDTQKKYAPTTSPFILKLIGTGFTSLQPLNNPLIIYANMGDFVSIIPQISSSTNLTIGNAYGYLIKSNTEVWIYFNRILFQNVWFKPSPDLKSYNGQDSVDKLQIECATSAYPFLSTLPTLKLFIAANNGVIQFKSDFFGQKAFKTKEIILTQSPYIITLSGAKKNSSIEPFLIPDGNNVVRSLSLFGHALQNKKVLMVKTSSKILSQNPSAIPLKILQSDQTEQNIKATSALELSILEYFKVGNFLEDLQTTEPSKITKADFFSANNTVVNSGDKGHLPVDNLPTIKFNIKTLPSSAYYVVVYDNNTGAYSVAPDIIIINASRGGMQIHDVSPTITTLKSPTFTINGFNFPVLNDINNGAILKALLSFSNSNTAIPISSNATLLINKTSNVNDINNNGSLTTDATKIIAKFSNLNFIIDDNTSTTIFLILQVSYPTQNISSGKINETQVSSPISLQAPPVISFLSNAETFSNINKTLVSIDQSTGQVIANAVPTNDLFVVGSNFGDGTNISVLLNGISQHINELKPWKTDTTLSALRITTNPSGLKGDVSVEVRVGDISSEPRSVLPDLSSYIFDPTTTNTDGVHSKGAQTITTPFFETILPFKHDNTSLLLNSKNTKVSSSIPVKLVNLNTKQSVDLPGKLDKTSNLSFLPNQIIIPDNTKLNADKTISIIFNFFNIFNVNISTPKITALLHHGLPLQSVFNPGEIMTVVGDGFVNGMRFNINKTGWKPIDKLFTFPFNGLTHQAFNAEVPESNGHDIATIQVSNDDAQKVYNINNAGKQNGPYKVKTIVVNDKYSPLLKINQRLPAGIKMYAKGPQVAMTDVIDANLSIYSQITPFLGGFKTLLVIIRVIVCIIDVICALVNPFQLIVAIIALMDCIIDLLSLFPQLAVPIMILSFLQNFIGFLQTFITQIEAYVFSIVNSQLAIVKAQITQDFGALAAAEQQSFSITKQIRDVISFLEPALQIIQIFKDLLSFAMHFPCASNQGSGQNNNTCPPPNIQQLISGNVGNNNVTSMTDDQKNTLSTMFCQAVSIQTNTLKTMPGFNGLDNFGNVSAPISPGSTSVVPLLTPVLPNISGAIECMNILTDNIENALNNGQTFITTVEQGQELIKAYTQCVQNLLDQTTQAIGDVCSLAVSSINSELKVSPKGSVGKDLSQGFIKTKIALPSIQPNDTHDAGLVLDLATITSPSDIPPSIITDLSTGSTSELQNFGLKTDIHTPIIVQTTNKSGQRQSKDTIYFNADNSDVGDLIVPGDILEIVGSPFNGLQFPILVVQKIFTAVRLTAKLDITFEQKLLVGEQMLPLNLSGFDVKIIAHLAGNDDIAVVPADNNSVATISIIARDHHGHELGPGIAERISLAIDSGDAEFVPIIPSSTTDTLGIIQEQGDHYIANIKSDCAGIVILSASVCKIELVDIGYFTSDPNHTISTRKKTIKVVFTPPIPVPKPGKFEGLINKQEPGSDFNN